MLVIRGFSVAAGIVAVLLSGQASVQAEGIVQSFGMSAADCRATAIVAVKIRTSKSSSATAVGQLNAGQSLLVSGGACTYETGGSYTTCPQSDNTWVPVRYQGVKRYVARMCVSLG